MWGRALLHGQQYLVRMVRPVIDGGSVYLEALSPASLIFQLPVVNPPQRSVSSLELIKGNSAPCITGSVGALRDLRHTKHMLRLLLYPLVAAHGGDAQDVEFVRLQEDQDGLLVAGAGTTEPQGQRDAS